MTWVATSLVEQALSNLQKNGPTVQLSPLQWQDELSFRGANVHEVSSTNACTEIYSTNACTELNESRNLQCLNLNRGEQCIGGQITRSTDELQDELHGGDSVCHSGHSSRLDDVDFQMTLCKLVQQTECSSNYVAKLIQRIADQDRLIDRLTKDNGYLIQELQNLETRKATNTVPRILLTPNTSPLSLRSNDFLLVDNYRCSRCGAPVEQGSSKVASEEPQRSGPRSTGPRSNGPRSAGGAPSLKSVSSYLRMKSEQTGVLFPIHHNPRLTTPVYIEDEDIATHEAARNQAHPTSGPQCSPDSSRSQVGTDCDDGDLCTRARVRMRHMPRRVTSPLSQTTSLSISASQTAHNVWSAPPDGVLHSPVRTTDSSYLDSRLGTSWGTRWISCSPQQPECSARGRPTLQPALLQRTYSNTHYLSSGQECFSCPNSESRHTNDLVSAAELSDKSPYCCKKFPRSHAMLSRAVSATHSGGLRPAFGFPVGSPPGHFSSETGVKPLRKRSSLGRFVRRVSGRRPDQILRATQPVPTNPINRIITKPTASTTHSNYDLSMACFNCNVARGGLPPPFSTRESVPHPEFDPLFSAAEDSDDSVVDGPKGNREMYESSDAIGPAPLARSMSGRGNITRKMKNQLRRTISLFQATRLPTTKTGDASYDPPMVDVDQLRLAGDSPKFEDSSGAEVPTRDSSITVAGDGGGRFRASVPLSQVCLPLDQSPLSCSPPAPAGGQR